uniref:carbonic anhydrase n=1 Tax=Tautonia sociabilis TaxID=2080755 RepID=UPI0021BC9892|nr:carbonic anhydrase [Tautonia sociabilis]
MNTINYIDRFDTSNPRATPLPATRRRRGRSWRTAIGCSPSEWRTAGLARSPTANRSTSCPATAWRSACLDPTARCRGRPPFAVVVGCSDARVPTEMLFGQGFNDLFVIRVAGNVLGDVCMESVDFALNALSESVRVVVMLGHSGCRAVSEAVDSYLSPVKFWSKSVSPMLRSITQRIFVAVREAASGFKQVWGPDAREMPGYREALIEAAVCLNAAQAAFNLRQEVERAAQWEIDWDRRPRRWLVKAGGGHRLQRRLGLSPAGRLAGQHRRAAVPGQPQRQPPLARAR